MSLYDYSFAKLCDPGRLTKEIEESSITIAISHIQTIASPEETKVWFKAELSSGEQDDLSALVTAHVNEPLPDTAITITTGKVDPITGREAFSTTAFAINSDYEVKAAGYRGTATASATTNVDFAIGAEDRYINGIRLMLKNHADADTIGLQIVDVDNVLGYGAGVVLKTFGQTWNVDDEQSDQGFVTFNYVARIMAGLYVRVVYVSTGGTNVTVKLNLLLHKKLA